MLKDYCIGDSTEYISVEYARSGRATCRNCKEKIGMDSLRIGILVDDDHFSTGQGTQWFHQNCFSFKPRHKVLKQNDLKQKIHNLENLLKKDQQKILNYLQNQIEKIKVSKASKKQKIKKQKKEQTKISQSKSQNSLQSYGKKSKSKNILKFNVKSNISLKKNQDIKKKSQQQISIRPNLRSRKSISRQPQQLSQSLKLKKSKKSLDKPQASVNKNKEKKVPKKKQKKNKSAPKPFVTEAQDKIYKQFLEKFQELTLNQLKEILQKNCQSKTGTKPQLAAKCADGKQFGRIPNCSSCGGGKLRFDRSKGTYTCPGYMQDTDFVHCNAKLSFEQVKRLEWIS